MRAVEIGYRVVGYDVGEDRVKTLAAGESYVEDLSAEALEAALAPGRYGASSSRSSGRLRRRRHHRPYAGGNRSEYVTEVGRAIRNHGAFNDRAAS